MDDTMARLERWCSAARNREVRMQWTTYGGQYPDGAWEATLMSGNARVARELGSLPSTALDAALAVVGYGAGEEWDE